MAGAACLMLAAACGSPAPAPSAQAPAAAAATSAAPTPAKAAATAPAAATKAASPAAASPAATQAAQPAASSGALAPLNVSYAGVHAGDMQLWVAEDAGIFKKNGLNVDAKLASNSQATMAALLSGQVQVAQTGGSDALSATASGASVSVIDVTIPVYSYVLEVPPSITSINELKGKKIGIDSFGSSPDIAVRVALQKAGLTPDKDVTILAVGDVPTRVAALEQGAIQGTVVNPPYTVTIEKKGYKPLVDLAKLKLPAVSQAAIVQKSFAQQHPDLVQRYIDSIMEATVKMQTDEPFTLGVMKKYLKSNDEEAMRATYDFYVHEVYPTVPLPEPGQFADSIRELSKRNPKIATVDLPKVLDPSFVQNAVSRGIVKASQ